MPLSWNSSPPVSESLHIAILGGGNRAGKYVSCLRGDVVVAAVVEPIALRRERLLRDCPGAKGYESIGALLRANPALDAVIIAAPDRLHVPLASVAAQRGWHILMEKPVAQSLEEYQQLLEATRGVTVGVCLEMRMHPYYRRIRELLPLVGQVQEVTHTEKIGADRMGHTFVRGLWASRDTSSPIFLSKCCHDTDWLLWCVGGKPVEVHSEGRLERFRASMAPSGSTDRCLQCPLHDCPYNAVRLYRERREWIDGFTPRPGETLTDEIERELRTGRYGRCVYRCDNDVNDFQKVDVRLDTGVRLHICLDGLSLEEGRETVVKGTRCELVARDWKIWLDGRQVEDFTAIAALPLHAGADRALVEDFFHAIRTGTAPAATLTDTLEAHRVCFLAG